MTVEQLLFCLEAGRHRPRRLVELQLACTPQHLLVNERFMGIFGLPASGERKTDGFVSKLADAPLHNRAPHCVQQTVAPMCRCTAGYEQGEPLQSQYHRYSVPVSRTPCD